MKDKIRVLIVEDEFLGARLLGRNLERFFGYEICGPVATGEEAVERAQTERPDIILMDLRLAGRMSGIEAAREIKSCADMPIIFVTGHGDVPTCVQAMHQGAVDFLEKPVDDNQFLSHVAQAVEQDVRRHRLEDELPDIEAHIDSLTVREREVMQLLFDGKTPKLIAAELGISIQTVAKHRTRMLEKLDVENEAELVRLLLCRQPESA